MPRNPFQLNIRENGPFWLTIAALSFAVMAVLVRMAGQRGIPGSETTAIRFAFGLVTILLLSSAGKADIRPHRIRPLVIRGIVGGIGILLYFMSLAAAKGTDAVPLTNSVFLGNSYFIYVPIFATFLLRERTCPGIPPMVFVALAGLYLITGADVSSLRAGNLYGFFAGIFNALSIIYVRDLRRTESPAVIFASLCVFGMLMAGVAAGFEGFQMPSGVGWWLLAGIGAVSTLGQMSLTYSLKYTPAGQAGIINMTTVIYSSAAGILWFGDPFNLRILTGAILVLATGAYISLTHSRLVHCE